METSDFLQADDILRVMQVPVAVAEGKITDDEIEVFIGLDSVGRQGRYYRLAAEKFGLIVNLQNNSSLTDRGRVFLKSPDQIGFLKNCMCSMPVFSEAIKLLGGNPQINLKDLKAWFLEQYTALGKSEETAERRFSTFKKYLSATGFV